MNNKITIANKITRTANKAGFKIKKHSPEILVGLGIISTVAGAVMACKASTKVSTIVDDTENVLDLIHESAEAGETTTEGGVVEYTEEDMKRDTTIVYAQTGLKFIKLYGPAVGLGVLGLATIITGHHILSKRTVALAAAYTSLDRSFKGYRNRVIERFGEELDRELKYNIRVKEFEEIKEDGKGKEKIVKNKVVVADANEYGDGAKFFDATCNGWCKDAELNLAFLKKTQNYANEKLRIKGYLFLNEVYDMLGMARTKAGQIIGWILDENDPKVDNYVDFGIYDINRESNRRFVNGYEPVILLEFNHDGPIVDRAFFEGGAM